ncbi:MAG: hypothetical protein ACI3T9_01000 [Romboutsia timonensis]
MDNKDGLWLDDLLCGEKLSGTEKLWRDIYRICDEFYLVISLVKYPITSYKKSYKLKVLKKNKESKWDIVLFNEEGMELEILLKNLKKCLTKYKDEHKEYNLQKSGGGEMI